MATKEEIAAEVWAYRDAKEQIGTMDDLAAKHNLTRARLYQIAEEVGRQESASAGSTLPNKGGLPQSGTQEGP